MSNSEVAKFRQEQALQEQAVQHALYSFASVATHSSITARMERGAEHLLTLLEEGKYEQVAHLMETTAWALEEVTCPITTNESIQHGLSAKGKSGL